jgi:hypothetical protein
MAKLYVLGINKASEVVSMLLLRRHKFAVDTVSGDPLRYISVFTAEAVAEVEALLEVI